MLVVGATRAFDDPKRRTTDPESPYARAREGVTRKQQESEPEPSVTEPLLLTVATDCGDESRGVRVDCAAHAVAKDSRSRALISSNLGRPRRRCATRALNLSPSLSGPVTSGEGRLQVHFAQWGESVGGTKSHPTRAREGVTRKQHLLNRDGSIPSATSAALTVQFRPTCAFFVLAPGRPLSPARTP